MERSEPTLVPQWLKNAGTSTTSSSVSHSDDHPASRVARNKSFVNSNGHEFGRSSGSEKTTSSYFRRSSSSNSSGSFRSYSTLGRNQRDRDLEKDTYDSRDQDNTILGDRRHRNISDPFGDASLSKFERDGLRRSQSMISGKRGDLWPKKVATDSGNASGKNTNGLLTKSSPVTGVSKATFERDFPSLGAEERVVIPEVGRVPSPGLSTAIQNLPVGTSASLAGEKWTSALAEVPVLVGSNGLQATPSSSMSVTLGPTTSLNMAEAVAQGPSRAQATPQLSVGTQRLEELAIKQSRQLIPVTPSMPKTLALNSSDKQRSKVGQQQHSSLPLNHSPRGGPVKGDVPKASNVGKLHVLKPAREKNGVTPVVKDNLSPTSGSSIAASPSVPGSASTKGPLNTAIPDRKPVMTVLEKRPTSQAQSRNDFFKLMRKKSMANAVSSDSTVESSQSVDTGPVASPSISDKHSEVEAMPATSHPVEAPSSVDHISEEKTDSICNGDACENVISNGEKHPSPDPIISEEEEAAFLRSLGWEENDDEGGLTEEEINAFYRDLSKYINSKPSLRILQRVQLKILMPLDSQLGGGIGGISSGLSSSDAKLES
ncbi:hypothetical protein ACS0TY_011524 [Phlomoides rotata]